jgi:hypothetical protein
MEDMIVFLRTHPGAHRIPLAGRSWGRHNSDVHNLAGALHEVEDTVAVRHIGYVVLLAGWEARCHTHRVLIVPGATAVDRDHGFVDDLAADS